MRFIALNSFPLVGRLPVRTFVPIKRNLIISSLRLADQRKEYLSKIKAWLTLVLVIKSQENLNLLVNFLTLDY